MGAWRTIRHRLEEAAAGVPVRYVGRPWRASTAEGYPTAHALEQERIARRGADALAALALARRRRRAPGARATGRAGARARELAGGLRRQPTARGSRRARRPDGALPAA